MSTTLVGHTAVNFNNEFIIIFGGLIDSRTSISSDNQNEFSDQVRIYEISSQSWLSFGISESCEKPSPRNFHSAIMHENKMIIFGGKSNGYLNDVWQFEFCKATLTGTWKKLSTKNNEIISPRFGHSAEFFNESMFVFGGYDSEGFVSNQLFELNLTYFEWKSWPLKHSKKLASIQPRYFHSSVMYNNLLIICGGKQNASTLIDDIVIIDLPEDRVELYEKEFLNCKIKKIPQPLTRYGHKVWTEHNRLFLLGGSNLDQDFTNLFSLNLENSVDTIEWKEEPFHFLSDAFSKFNAIGPLFHTVTLYKIDESSWVLYFFPWGGKYSLGTTRMAGISSHHNDGHQLLSTLNQDVLFLILQYLTPKDLNSIQLASKTSLLSQLSIHDKLWKPFFLNHIQQLQLKDPRVVGVNLYNFVQQLSVASATAIPPHQQFKNHWIEIGKMKIPLKFHFRPKHELLKIEFERRNSSNTKNWWPTFRIVVIGGSNVGKTTMQIVLSTHQYPTEYVPTIFECERPIKLILFGCYLQTIDTAGGYDYDMIRYLSYSPPPDLTIVVYSINSRESFLQVKNTFLEETRRHSPKTPVLLLGTMIDLREKGLLGKKRIVSYEEGESFAREVGCLSFTEISSMSGEGFDEFMELIVKCCFLQQDSYTVSTTDSNTKKCIIQ